MISDHELKTLQKKLCCRNCHSTIIKKISELETIDEIEMMRDQLRILNNSRTLPTNLERDIRNIIMRRKENETYARNDG